jgi:hypothetical protein
MENIPNMRNANTKAREIVARNSNGDILSVGCMKIPIEGIAKS